MNSESTNNKQANNNKVDLQLSWIIASLGQVAHFTSVVIRNVLATSGWVHSAHTAPYAKSAHNSLVKAIAFTLAETLVVMGIIGIVAALTIPNLNQSTGDREKVAKVRKIYSNLQDAYGRATAVYGPYEEWFINDNNNAERSKRMAERITEFMKVSKSCENEITSACMKEGEFTNIGGSDYTTGEIVQDDTYSYLLADGTSITFDGGAWVFVDIDGPNKGQFKRGVDVFKFSVNQEEGVYYDSWSGKIKAAFCVGYCPDCDSTCEGWIIRYGNMDYLKADSNGKCPNGIVLDGETNTTCK